MKRRSGFYSIISFILLMAMVLTSGAFTGIRVKAAKEPELSKSSVSVSVGSSRKISVKNRPAGAKVTWSTKDKSVAKVSRGRVTGVRKGRTSVTAKVSYKNNGKKITKKLTAKVKVKAKPAGSKNSGSGKTKDTAGQSTSGVQNTSAVQSTSNVQTAGTETGQTAAATQIPSAGDNAAAVPEKTPDAVSETTPAADPEKTAGADAEKTPAASEASDPANVPDGTAVPEYTPYPEPEAPADLKDVLEETNVGEEHESASGIKTKDNGIMRRELSSLDLTDYEMGIGWNLGNQLEESNAATGFKHKTVEECETNAGNPAATQTTFDGLKKYGVNTVRIPVAWSNLMSDDGTYTINKELLDRVETVANYALNNGMYVIINEHWDGGWWGMFGSPDENVRAEAWKKYESMWKQIAERFRDYSDHLLFAAGNEELSSAFSAEGNAGLNTKVGENGFFSDKGPLGTLTEDEIYETAYEISQKFVDIFRESGGNNRYRHLIIPGNTTAINKACDERFRMPSDIEENGNDKLSCEVHIYDPQGFGLTAASGEEGYRSSWGGEADEKYLRDLISRMKKFTDQGYGVIAGECGIVKADKDNIPDWMRYFFNLCREFHITPCLWDEGHYFNRAQGYFNYSDYAAVISEYAGVDTPKLPKGIKESDLRTTGVCKVPASENKNPKVLYTWEGAFMRHAYGLDNSLEKWKDYPDLKWLKESTDGKDCEAGIYTETLKSEGMTVIPDSAYWNMSIKADWSSIEKPCVRVYPESDIISQAADLQLGYVAESDGAPKGTAKDASDYTSNWIGEYIELDKEDLTTGNPWLWITTNYALGTIYTKVEICDAAYNSDGTAYVSQDE